MNPLIALVLPVAFACTATTALAAGNYNTPLASDKQFASCIAYLNAHYEGGTAASPVRGQSKAQAFCTCVWNETPENFKGSLAKFAESTKGKAINTICEKYSDWVN